MPNWKTRCLDVVYYTVQILAVLFIIRGLFQAVELIEGEADSIVIGDIMTGSTLSGEILTGDLSQ